MSEAEKYEIVADCVRFHPTGDVLLPEAVKLVNEAIAFTLARGIPKLLVNATQLTGFPPPTVADRYFMVREWAATGKSAVRFALVVTPEMIDPERFGVMVGQNAGMRLNVFSSEPEALAWLTGGPGG